MQSANAWKDICIILRDRIFTYFPPTFNGPGLPDHRNRCQFYSITINFKGQETADLLERTLYSVKGLDLSPCII